MSTSVREARLRRHRRVRGKISGTAERPRLVVFRSNRGHLRAARRRRSRADARLRELALGALVQGDEDRSGRRGRQGAGRRCEEGRNRHLRLRPGRLPVPRTRQGAAPRRAREDSSSDMSAVEVAESRELKERVIEINRVAKVVKGGRRFSFTALVVIGDEVDRVGVGYGKARRSRWPSRRPSTMRRRTSSRCRVPRDDHRRDHGPVHAARAVLRPASEAAGVIAGRRRPRRARAPGIRDAPAKSLGTTNLIFNMARATVRRSQAAPPPRRTRQARGKGRSTSLRAAVPAAGLLGSRRAGCRSRSRRVSLRHDDFSASSRSGARSARPGRTRARSARSVSDDIGRTADHKQSAVLDGQLRHVAHLVTVTPLDGKEA